MEGVQANADAVIRSAAKRLTGKQRRLFIAEATQALCAGNPLGRITYPIVAGRQVFRHPSLQGRPSVLDKLLAFHREHETDAPTLLRDLQAALEQLSSKEHPAEANPLYEELKKIQEGGRRGPQLLGDILPMVLARLGVGAVPSKPSGESDPRERSRASEPRTPFVPKAQSLRKAWRSLGSPTADTAAWGRSPDVPVGRGVTTATSEVAR